MLKNLLTYKSKQARLSTSAEAVVELRKGVTSFLNNIEKDQQEFQRKKQLIEKDMQRGSRLSKGRIPF